MSFTKQDERASAAVDRLHAGPIIWRPMRVNRNRPTGGGRSPDPDRPVRGLDQKTDPFVAITTWRTLNTDPGTNVNEQATLPLNDVMVDIDRRRFRTPGGAYFWPKAGDQFEIPSRRQEGTVKVQLHSDPVDDGSMRVQCYCGAEE